VSFFIARRSAGVLTTYVPGLLVTDYWQRRNLAQIERDDPKFVVLVEDFAIDDRPENRVPAYLPLVWAYVQREYPEEAFRVGSIVVRGKRPR
jgi:hypothetical protein